MTLCRHLCLKRKIAALLYAHFWQSFSLLNVIYFFNSPQNVLILKVLMEHINASQTGLQPDEVISA